MDATKRAWDAIVQFTKADVTLSPDSPLWGNSNYSHLAAFSEVETWTEFGLKRLSQVYTDGTFHTLPKLRQLLSLPDLSEFRYNQISHLCSAQFPTPPLRLHCTGIEELISQPTKVKLLSNTYKHLISNRYDPRVKYKWESSGVRIDPDDWEEIIDNLYIPLVSMRDRLIQFRIIHQTYLTPQKLFTMGRVASPSCPRCGAPVANFIHLMWDCPVILRFWRAIVNFMATELELPQILNPATCLLGLLDSVVPRVHTRCLIRLLFFYAKKVVALHWMVNSQLELYKLTYLARGCPKKFENIWNPWLESPATSTAR
ncbi:uncharacterized protein LOC121398297 [Xenopus laevis]|uniref:Uncharacterized protein LOC121398297 n=1 Tax=Xenopus laevis TaxID=8355 RepID=A0A8J1LUS9_XENLA|nr:uncharacterized protein LOC121398297 [Xenopus laevis]